MSSSEKQFDYKINQIKNNVPGASEDCINILREMNNAPSYSLGEMQPIMNEKIDSLCKATGESYESVAIKMSMTKVT